MMEEIVALRKREEEMRKAMAEGRGIEFEKQRKLEETLEKERAKRVEGDRLAWRKEAARAEVEVPWIGHASRVL